MRDAKETMQISALGVPYGTTKHFTPADRVTFHRLMNAEEIVSDHEVLTSNNTPIAKTEDVVVRIDIEHLYLRSRRLLTQKERRVLRWYRRDKTEQAIAKKMGVSRSTVRNTRARAIRKLENFFGIGI